MDGWMDEWMDGWMGGWMDESMLNGVSSQVSTVRLHWDRDNLG